MMEDNKFNFGCCLGGISSSTQMKMKQRDKNGENDEEEDATRMRINIDESLAQLTAVEQVMRIQMIMEEIFLHLTFDDLKACRMVSPSWRRMASKEMLGRDERIKFLYYMGESKKVSMTYLLLFLQNPRLRLRLLGL